jgi:hypothetical protein
MIDEFDRRKDNFDLRNSVAVTFVDDQVFYVPKPWLEIRPAFRDGRAVTAYPVYTNGPVIDELLTIAGESDDGYERVAATASIAAILLEWHYELDSVDLDKLLAFRIDDPASAGWGERVIDVVTGAEGPKRSRAGSD